MNIYDEIVVNLSKAKSLSNAKLTQLSTITSLESRIGDACRKLEDRKIIKFGGYTIGYKLMKLN